MDGFGDFILNMELGDVSTAGNKFTCGRLEKVQEVKAKIKNHFELRFSESNHLRSMLEGVGFRQLSLEDKAFLEAPFALEEVKEVIWSGDKDKSSGLDDFNLGFFKVCWNFLKEYIARFANEFHDCGIVPKAITASFLSLVPKGDNP
ncbi:hypothetical protein KIW84_021469 [Lathyrus oleraceus]|uniref:Uncharacterized protein n=1 Tax=Pisum sativum TaxID=3888 RepID=A0A9D4Y7Y0_PEA|nr:hypothetical protein KIW84_021469 [Pisum sativum]